MSKSILTRFGEMRQRPLLVILIAVVLIVVAAGAGVKTGGLLAGKGDSDAKLKQLDEQVGLGERTGMTGGLVLNVSPSQVTLRPGATSELRLTLTNRSRTAVRLNRWFEPLPAAFENNQFPLKVRVYRDGRPVRYSGANMLRQEHGKADFTRLGRGDSLSVPLTLPGSRDAGHWDMSVPGRYSVEIWYETYLTGKYAGVKAWTGMTNHVVVRAVVAGPKSGSR